MRLAREASKRQRGSDGGENPPVWIRAESTPAECEAWNVALPAEKLVRGSSAIQRTPGKTKDLADCPVSSLCAPLSPLSFNLACLEAKK